MRLGHQKIYRMPIGYMGWLKSGGPIKTGSPEKRLLASGDYFPECELISVKESATKQYLEVEAFRKSFALSDIPASFLFVEIFNERCFGCIEEITNYKTLFVDFMRPDFFHKIKILGIGAGSDISSINRFKKRNQIPFPLFPDKQWNLFECLGSPALPSSYLIAKKPDGRRQIVYAQSGHIEDIEGLKLLIHQHVNHQL